VLDAVEPSRDLNTSGCGIAELKTGLLERTGSFALGEACIFEVDVSESFRVGV
jgi:hypothetical protein